MNIRALFEELTRNDERCFDREFDERLGCYVCAKTQVAYQYFCHGICAASKQFDQAIDLAKATNENTRDVH